MTELTRTQKAKLADYFFSRARGERTTALAFEHIIQDLQNIPATSGFIRMAESARQDELRHSGICMKFVERYSEGPLPELRVRGERPVRFPYATEADQDQSNGEDPTLGIYGCPPPKYAAAAVEKALAEVILPGFEITGFRVSR